MHVCLMDPPYLEVTRTIATEGFQVFDTPVDAIDSEQRPVVAPSKG
jgi:hypothetical protein